ncbi:unannotated protein [freshwater metagenome]|uniref:Unannotated protein n=1 Tax=freshwater metagenome TaxID=449393 RepID=A0A6J7CT21_9ZZZZ|nr:hypothetical protein [Actinomycetota bacterium]
MAESPNYGTPNYEMIKGWFSLTPEQDPPFWAINLMKYRAVAAYADGRETTRSGRDADDEYTPFGPLKAIGAMVAFAGDVTDQTGSDPAWDRVGIVRYPSRSAFIAMQQREDFKGKHVHKEAGMEFTIVMSCSPVWCSEGEVPAGGSYIVRVTRFADGALTPAGSSSSDPEGVRPIARFNVEGVIVGDERRWDEVRFDWVDDTALAAITASDAAAEQFTMTLRVFLDNLVSSVADAPQVG